MNTENNNTPNNTENEETFDLKNLVRLFGENLHWFILCTVIGLGIAWAVNHYTIPVYNMQSSVLINDEKKGSGLGSIGAAAAAGGDVSALMGSASKTIDNQVAILSSYSQIERTLKELNFQVSYYTDQFLHHQELYKDCPFTVLFDTTHVQPVNVKFYVKLSPSGKIKLKVEGKKALVYNYQDQSCKRLQKLFYIRKRNNSRGDGPYPPVCLHPHEWTATTQPKAMNTTSLSTIPTNRSNSTKKY